MSNTENGAHDISNDTELPPDPGAEHAVRTAALAEEVADLKDRLLRALAETENVRRRGERELEDARKYAVSKFAGDLLTVADNLRRALDAVPEAERGEGAIGQVLSGVEATERELLQVFDRAGLKQVNPVGQAFDPHLHEVMFEMDAPAGIEPGAIAQVYQPGYTLHGRLLRPARVAVAKGGAKAGGMDTKA